MSKRQDVHSERLKDIIKNQGEMKEGLRTLSTQAYMEHKAAKSIFPLKTLDDVKKYLAEDKPAYVKAVARVSEVSYSRRLYSAHIVQSLFVPDLIVNELSWFSTQ